MRQFLLRGDQPGRKLLAQAKLDLVGFQRSLDRIAFLLFRLALLLARFGGIGLALARLAARHGNADERHCAAEQEERKGRKARHDAQNEKQERRNQKRLRISAKLAENRLIGRAARAAFRHEKPGSERNDQSRNLCYQTIAHRQFGENIGGLRNIHPMAGRTNDDAAKNIDGRDYETGNRIAAYEFRRAIHGTKERAFLLQFTAAALRLLSIDQAR
ncbi:Uncharacterised protein [Brucella neotomae]|nr:Uncharacterised protein [Brucella neotomae]